MASLAEVSAGLHRAATAACGWTDFGDPEYRVGLDRLLQAIEASAHQPAERELIRTRSLLPVLVGRLYSERAWGQRPAVRGLPLAEPLVICGLPRSGTTALHKLMSVDSRFQGLEAWLAVRPMPRPARERWASIPEFRAIAGELSATMAGSAGYRAAHFRAASEVDECLRLMSQSFVSNLFPSTYALPDYDRWFRVQDQRPTYRRYADNLRLIGAGEPERPWLLKNPGHLGALDAFLDVFPDARIVQTHRHPEPAIASLCSLLASVRTAMLGRSASVDGISEREVGFWGDAVNHAMAVRDRRRPDAFDVDFRRFTEDPLAIAVEIYDHFGIDLQAATLAAMRAWVTANPQGRHGIHAYDARLAGVTRELFEKRFGAYITRYGLAS